MDDVYMQENPTQKLTQKKCTSSFAGLLWEKDVDPPYPQHWRFLMP